MHPHSAAADLTPGHAYVPSGRVIYEYDSDLNLASTTSMIGKTNGVSGATISPENNLVYIANVLKPDGITYDRTSVIEVDFSTGEIVRGYDMIQRGLNSGQSIKYNPRTNMYAVSDAGHIVYLDANLELIGISERFAQESLSGIEFLSDNRIVVSQAVGSRDLRILNTDLSLSHDVFVGRYGICDMVALNDTTLVLTDSRDNLLETFDLVTGNRQRLFDTIQYPQVDIQLLPNGNYLFNHGSGLLSLYSPEGVQLAINDQPAILGSGVVYYVPSTGTLMLAGGVLVAASRKRRI